jgi:hypothetical protein
MATLAFIAGRSLNGERELAQNAASIRVDNRLRARAGAKGDRTVANTAIRLTDPHLFGNDAAEDEDAEVLESYAIERPELGDFTSASRRICIARAYKGEGKSALLRLSASQVERSGEPQIVVFISANSLSPTLDTADFPAWIRAWKAAILGQLAAEVGATIGAAWSDDTMSLVEEAERQGFKSRSVVSAILDRLKIGQLDLGALKVNPLSQQRLGATNPEKVLQRWAKQGTRVWLFIDDVDLNFQNTASQKAKVASFFVACREVVNTVKGLSLRAAVRPSVWTIIKLEFEALSHVEQYIHDLRWSEDAIRTMLARRVEAYLKRNSMWKALEGGLPGNAFDRDKALIGEVFQPSMNWGTTTRPPHVLIYTLSKHRPRWAIELSKAAAASAARKDRAKIGRDDIFENLGAFGRRRIEDTCAEFRSQCPQIDELIGAFAREPEQLQTDALLKLIDNRVLSHLTPQIVGVAGKPTARDVAAFLFQVGIFFGRRELPDGGYEHVDFSEQPGLWQSRTDLDRGLSWEVHPVFRQALEIRDDAGREFAPPQRRPSGSGRRPI